MTAVYVNGDLDINSKTLTFYGEVYLLIRGSLNIRSNVTINSEQSGGDYSLRTYIYNVIESGNVRSLNISEGTDGWVSNTNLKGDFFIDYYEEDNDGIDKYGNNGDVFMYFHQNTFIDGNIVYNGSGQLKIKTQPNNLNSLSKLISGSIYAPYADVILGDSTEKVAFVIDGLIFADNIEIYAKNNALVSKFFMMSFESGVARVPVITDKTVNEISTIAFGSYYAD